MGGRHSSNSNVHTSSSISSSSSRAFRHTRPARRLSLAGGVVLGGHPGLLFINVMLEAERFVLETLRNRELAENLVFCLSPVPVSGYCAGVY